MGIDRWILYTIALAGSKLFVGHAKKLNSLGVCICVCVGRPLCGWVRSRNDYAAVPSLAEEESGSLDREYVYVSSFVQSRVERTTSNKPDSADMLFRASSCATSERKPWSLRQWNSPQANAAAFFAAPRFPLTCLSAGVDPFAKHAHQIVSPIPKCTPFPSPCPVES
ncbi:hypothetical protein AK830_g619 [Neonectria ditissima]|uniref:Uncharacterized protein n=1 Tax=Neonectria ditissima TaxID=78410 RepID=A0A0P7BXZ2_9HYPO|nr:hypothetical protein AK830_g619 [Neonectria ditissima]